MKVLLVVDGWEKFIDVDKNIVDSGVIKLYQPHKFFGKLTEVEQINEETVEVLIFHYVGEMIHKNIPVFECE